MHACMVRTFRRCSCKVTVRSHSLVFRRPKVTLMYYIDYELLDELEQNIVVLSVDGLIIVVSFSYKASLKTL